MPEAESDHTLTDELAEALHRYVCAEPWDACCWAGEDPDLTDCRLPGGAWRPTGIEPALAPVIVRREALARYFAFWRFFLSLRGPSPLSDAVQREAMRLRALVPDLSSSPETELP